MSGLAVASSAVRQLTSVFTGPDTLVLVSRVRDGAVLALSPGFARLLEVSEEQALGRTAIELGLWRDPDKREGIVALLRQRGSVTGEPISVESRNGRHYDGLMSCSLVEVEGEVCFFALVQDIHEHATEAQARLRENQSFRTLIMESAVGVYRRLAGGALQDVNPALAQLLGYRDVHSLLAAGAGHRHFDYVDPEHGARLDALLAEHGRVQLLRAEVRRPDGSVLPVSENARAVRGRDGAILFVEGSLTDVTTQVAAEAALTQSESLYRNLVENSRDGVFLMQHGRVQFANDALASILGHADAGVLIGQSYFDWVAPEDLAAQAERRRSRESGSVDTQEYEIRLIRRDGTVRTCAVRAGAVGFRGAPASIGTLRDVTEVRAQQKRVEAAEERYRLLFQHAVLGMFQSALDGRLIEVNHAMASMFGFDSPAQMCAEVPDMRPWYVDPAARDDALVKIQRDGQIIGHEFELKRRDGGSFWALSSARIVHHHGEEGGHLEGSLLDISARRVAEQELKYLAEHDSLTQLLNRRSFEQLLRLRLAEAQADGAAHAVLLLDLDRFKLVNDSLGHAAGDELLVKFSERLQAAVDERAWLARYGGDEFALLSRQPLDVRGAIALAQRVHGVLNTPFHLRGHQVFSGAAIGIVLLDAHSGGAEELMRDADTAMFRAKGRGGGHAVFDTEMHNAARERLALETELRFALDRGELLAFYQPVWTLDSRQIVGVEALVRWQHPQRGLLGPAHFLHVAEEAGMLPAIDLQVLEQALVQFGRWREQYGRAAPPRLSVNVSDRLFAAADFPATLRKLLEQTGADPGQVHLEITETVFRGQASSLKQTLAALKRLGVKLVVDDFGTGYSSLVSFSESDFDGLKVDRGFVHDLETNARHRAIVRTIAQFAHDLDLSLVAEGVENEVQVQLLRQLGCEQAQGFCFAPALAAGALGARLGVLPAARRSQQA